MSLTIALSPDGAVVITQDDRTALTPYTFVEDWGTGVIDVGQEAAPQHERQPTTPPAAPVPAPPPKQRVPLPRPGRVPPTMIIRPTEFDAELAYIDPAVSTGQVKHFYTTFQALSSSDFDSIVGTLLSSRLDQSVGNMFSVLHVTVPAEDFATGIAVDAYTSHLSRGVAGINEIRLHVDPGEDF